MTLSERARNRVYDRKPFIRVKDECIKKIMLYADKGQMTCPFSCSKNLFEELAEFLICEGFNISDENDRQETGIYSVVVYFNISWKP